MFYLNLSIFTAFLKNKNIIFKIRRSKVTDYAALSTNFQTKYISGAGFIQARLCKIQGLFKDFPTIFKD